MGEPTSSSCRNPGGGEADTGRKCSCSRSIEEPAIQRATEPRSRRKSAGGLSRVRAIREAAALPCIAREIPAVWGGSGAGKDESVADGSDHAGARDSRRTHAAAAAGVFRAGTIAAALLPAPRSARAIYLVQRIEAPGDMAERIDDAIRLLPERAGRLP